MPAAASREPPHAAALTDSAQSTGKFPVLREHATAVLNPGTRVFVPTAPRVSSEVVSPPPALRPPFFSRPDSFPAASTPCAMSPRWGGDVCECVPVSGRSVGGRVCTCVCTARWSRKGVFEPQEPCLVPHRADRLWSPIYKQVCFWDPWTAATRSCSGCACNKEPTYIYWRKGRGATEASAGPAHPPGYGGHERFG